MVGRAGRKVTDDLTLEFRTSATDTLATAAQKGSVDTLLGFRNGGAATYGVTGDLLLALCVDVSLCSHSFLRG